MSLQRPGRRPGRRRTHHQGGVSSWYELGHTLNRVSASPAAAASMPAAFGYRACGAKQTHEVRSQTRRAAPRPPTPTLQTWRTSSVDDTALRSWLAPAAPSSPDTGAHSTNAWSGSSVGSGGDERSTRGRTAALTGSQCSTCTMRNLRATWALQVSCATQRNAVVACSTYMPSSSAAARPPSVWPRAQLHTNERSCDVRRSAQG